MNIRASLMYKQCGMALVLVLWMLVLLTVMAGGYSATMRTETILTAHQLQSARARAMAQAGIWLAVNELLKPQLERSWQSDGSLNTVDFNNGSIEIKIQDETGKIDLNTARVELLHGLIKSVEVEDALGIELLHAILDWRDKDDLVRTAGAEDDDYKAAGLEYGAKDGLFNSVDELRLILGMTEEIFRKMEPALTIHSHQAGINPSVAQREVLLAIPGVYPETIEDFLLERSETSLATNSPSLAGTDKRFLTRVKDNTLTITSVGISADSKMKLDAVILIKRNANPPFTVLSWWQGKPEFQSYDQMNVGDTVAGTESAETSREQ